MVDRVLLHRIGVVLFAAATTFAVLIAAAVSVAACTSLATLEASGSAIPLGQVVNVSGRHFATDPALSPIEVRDSATNTLLWSGRPDENGDFTATLATADFSPGYHVIVASERDAKGQAVSGTPARVVVKVVSGVERASGAVHGGSTSAAARASTASASPVALALAAGAGAAMLAVISFSVWVVARRSRRRARARSATLDMWERSLSHSDEVLAGHAPGDTRDA